MENRTKNGDLEKVMGTVASFIVNYLNQFTDHQILVRGNTEGKRRLYNRFASRSLEEITKDYNLYGKEYDNDEFALFAKGKIYEALLVKESKELISQNMKSTNFKVRTLQ